MNEIIWSQSDQITMYFIFIEYLKTGGGGFKRNHQLIVVDDDSFFIVAGVVCFVLVSLCSI